MAEREQKSATTEQIKNAAQFVGFQLADQQYAFPIEQIQEIVNLDQITIVPQVPEYVEGVSNLRGSIIPIINLRKLFGLETKAGETQARIIVVNVGERTIGCTVDQVSQVIRIPEEEVQPAPDTVTMDGAQYITGFAKVNNSLMILLDVDLLLDVEQLERVRTSALHDVSSSL